MSRDLWLKQLRIAGGDAKSVENVLAGEVPVDGLQHAGDALLRAGHSEGLVQVAGSLIEALARRGWTGDPELITELEHYSNRRNSDLVRMSVDLAQLGEAVDRSAGSESYIDVATGVLWPAELFDFDEGPDDFDEDSDRWLLVFGLGSRPAYETMERFAESVEHPDITSRLTETLVGPGAFRRFQRELSRYEGEYTRWHRFRDDARLGRARTWLADHGYQSNRRSV